ncbi:MAG: glycosyltransferase family 39 protein [Methanobrevibacter sp.]|jgi:dolichyl-diphosphooligosaccharide--protein glycosyltransferase|nr:glycosyltransferase family 39 protein [Methanobrevibacter sp.]
MEKEKKMKILKSVLIVVILVSIAFTIRAQTYNVGTDSPEVRGMFTDSDGLPYFSEMDSYYHLRLVEDIVNHGYLGDTVINNSVWDEHRLSPDGIAFNYQPMIFYVTLLFFKIVSLIFANIPIKFVAYWTGALLGSLTVIPAFLIVKKITNDYGGIVAALLVAMSPNFFSHTFAGFYDTDMFTVLLPLLMLFFFIESFRQKNTKYRIISTILAAATVIIFSISWVGYIFYPAIFVFAIILFLIIGVIFKLNLIKPLKNYKNILDWFINQKEIFAITIFICLSFVGLLFTTEGINGVSGAISRLIGSVNLQNVGTAINDYPNVMISVGEMQKPEILYGGLPALFSSSSGGLINAVGGILVLFSSLIMIFVFISSFWKLRNIKNKDLKNKKLSKSKRKSAKSFTSSQQTSFISKFSNQIINKNIEESKKEILFYLSIFGSWIFISLIASLTASRFIPFLVIPIALTSGIFVGYLHDYIKKYMSINNQLYICILCSILISYSLLIVFYNFIYPGIILVILFTLSYIMINLQKDDAKWLSKFKGIKKLKITGSFVIILISLTLIAPTITGAYNMSIHSQPGTSDPMWNAMQYVNETQPNNTVIASWWDFGYLFEIAADKMTVFDGGAQSGQRAYWIGKAISTSNDKLSKGILEMLATTGDKAANTLYNYTKDKGKSAGIIEEILPIPKTDAISTLTGKYNLTQIQAETVTNYTHPDNPRPVVFVMSSDMISKSGWWTYFGSWDFESQESKQLSYITPNSQYSSQVTQNENGSTIEVVNYAQGQGNNSIVYKTIIDKHNDGSIDAKFVATHDDGSPIKLQDGTDFTPRFGNKEVSLANVKLVEDGNLTATKTLNESGDFSAFVIGEQGMYQGILMQKDLEDSMFTKLYLNNGAGQSSFENINKQNGVSLWKVKR